MLVKLSEHQSASHLHGNSVLTSWVLGHVRGRSGSIAGAVQVQSVNRTGVTIHLFTHGIRPGLCK